MPDYHVVSIHYRVEPGPSIEFNSSSQISGTNSEFSYSLADGLLTLVPSTDFSSEEEVRPVADSFVRGWEISTGLENGNPQIRFKFDRVTIEDRDPPPQGTVIMAAGTGIVVITGCTAVMTFTRGYPPPPPDFQITAEVDGLWTRYQRYREGKEPITTLGYYVLTVIERYGVGAKGGKRDAAARYLNIDSAILNKLGDITTNKGGLLVARKVQSVLQPLTQTEIVWVDAAVRALIGRLAMTHPASTSIPLMLKDLPSC